MNYMKTTNWYMRIYMVLGLCVIIGMIINHNTEVREIQKVKYIAGQTRTIIIKERDEFTEDKLKAFMLQINIKFPHIVLAQAKIESGNFRSNQFKKNNNIFGMKVAKRRPTMNIGNKSGFAKFSSWKDCVIDYAFYQASYMRKIKTEDEYLEYLKDNYASNPMYVKAIKKMIEDQE
jgi:uncharacterized FlgJ-related protein